MVLQQSGCPLELIEREEPAPGPNQVSLKVSACGVCRTDLHVLDGELSQPKIPLVLGHEIIGTVQAFGDNVEKFQTGDRIGVPWLGRTCGECDYCRNGRENLCDQAGFTGYTLDGGYTEYAVAHQHFCFSIPDNYSDIHAAPLLCAGLIGYRALRMSGGAKRLGIYGFGAAAHILAQVIVHQGRELYAFTRPGDDAAQDFALSLGAVWAGNSTDAVPVDLDAAIIFAPVGSLVPLALRAVRKGGTVVCAGIHMSEIPAFPYEVLWGERSLRSVANLTRRDGEEFMQIAASMSINTEVKAYPLEKANQALDDLRKGRFQGAAVLECCSA